MRFEHALQEFKDRIKEEYGFDPTMKITFDNESFDRIIIRLLQQSSNPIRFNPSDVNDYKIAGVRIQARSKREIEE